MKTPYLLSALCYTLLPGAVIAGGFYEVASPPAPRYICFDGRKLNCTPAGFAWKAKRGCFLSVEPCDRQHAGLYGYFPNPKTLMFQYQRCQEGYPFRLGEIQVI